jgi:GAF domain-containing protein
MAVPIVLNQELIGMITLDKQVPGFYTDQHALLAMAFAAPSATALNNARLFDETQRLLKESEQRAAELAVINSVQEGLASQLKIQGIYDLVGDKIREIFAANTVVLATFDLDKKTMHRHYTVEKGQRYFVEPTPIPEIWLDFIRQGQPVLINNNLAAFVERIDPDFKPPAGEIPKSAVAIPLTLRGELRGVISLQDIDRENAFGESDMHLLQTNNSMSVALENARLFDESQHLLKETEQRAAELAAVNTVSAALAGELDLNALIHLVGEQTRALFKADIAYVALLDEPSAMINFVYTYGEELTSIRFGEGLTSKVIETNQPLLINQELDRQVVEIGVTVVGRKSLSYLGVPISVSGEAVGVLSVQSTSQEGIFHEADARLLSTIAAGVGTALHNAQLFDELRREQRSSQEAQHRLADIISFLPDATLVIDREGKVIAWNRATEEMTGVPAEVMLGQDNYAYAIPFYGERRPILIDLVLLPSEVVEKKYAQIQRTGEILTGEAYTPALKGGSHYLYATASPLHDAQGNIVGAIETIRDITDRKHTEEERKARADAEQLTPPRAPSWPT